MTTISLTGASAADVLWAKTLASRRMNEAAQEIAAARSSLGRLVTDTEWESQGVRSLHELLEELRVRIVITVAEIAESRAQVAAIEVP